MCAPKSRPTAKSAKQDPADRALLPYEAVTTVQPMHMMSNMNTDACHPNKVVAFYR